jgi:predicted SAM-dependent methyltransferase
MKPRRKVGRPVPVAVNQPLRLNLGAGDTRIEGFRALDGASGDVLYPLPFADGTVDEIRASHVLEHFPHAQVAGVLADWVRALKPGGVLRVAVPDFEQISRAYLAGKDLPLQGYVMGGQVDERDVHRTVFDREMLGDLLRTVGLVAIRDWSSEIADCARLPISLNLAGTKAGGPRPNVAAVLTMPRLGFNDFWGAALDVLGRMGIPMRRQGGAYWEQGITRAIVSAIEDHQPDYVLTLDYDTVFDRNAIECLLDIAVRHPDLAAIAPLQSARHHSLPMFTVDDGHGGVVQNLTREYLLSNELVDARTAHFGCTLLKVAALKRIPQPWFRSEPGPHGDWRAGEHQDADILFWSRLKAAGLRAVVAPRVVVGHCELMILWPDQNLEVMHQSPNDFRKEGVPEGKWR